MMKKTSKMKSKSKIDLTAKIIIGTILAIYAVTILFPLVWGVITSLKSDFEFAFLGNVVSFPTLEDSAEELKLANYKLVLDNFIFKETKIFYIFGNVLVTHKTESGLLEMLINTLIYALGGSILMTFVSCTVAYLTAKYKFKFSSFVYLLALFMMTVPVVGSAPSLISVLRMTGLYDTLYGMLIQKLTFTGMYFFVFFAYFQAMPDSYAEAAEIDGASQLRIYFSIILPLAIKTFSTVVLIYFVALWNDFEGPLLYMPTVATLAYGVYNISLGSNSGVLVGVPEKVAACMFLALPILVIFIAFKDRLMGNISAGGIKG